MTIRPCTGTWRVFHASWGATSGRALGKAALPEANGATERHQAPFLGDEVQDGIKAAKGDQSPVELLGVAESTPGLQQASPRVLPRCGDHDQPPELAGSAGATPRVAALNPEEQGSRD